MRKQADGDLEVSIGEKVTVQIEATGGTAFLAHASGIRHGQWEVVSNPTLVREVREFTVGPAFSKNFSFTTDFDFSATAGGPIPAGAQYSIRITGSGPGGAVRQRTIVPGAILPVSLVFSFEVGQG
jgi:hypothetical protein